MLQNFALTPPGGGKPITVAVDSRDALVWERTNRRHRSVVDLSQGSTIEDQYDLAYLAARRTGAVDVTRKDFDAEWLVEAVGEDREEDPTNPAQ